MNPYGNWAYWLFQYKNESLEIYRSFRPPDSSRDILVYVGNNTVDSCNQDNHSIAYLGYQAKSNTYTRGYFSRIRLWNRILNTVYLFSGNVTINSVVRKKGIDHLKVM